MLWCAPGKLLAIVKLLWLVCSFEQTNHEQNLYKPIMSKTWTNQSWAKKKKNKLIMSKTCTRNPVMVRFPIPRISVWETLPCNHFESCQMAPSWLSKAAFWCGILLWCAPGNGVFFYATGWWIVLKLRSPGAKLRLFCRSGWSILPEGLGGSGRKLVLICVFLFFVLHLSIISSNVTEAPPPNVVVGCLYCPSSRRARWGSTRAHSI